MEVKKKAGEYTISSQIVIKTPDRRTELWSTQDALVLKAMSIVLGEHLKPIVITLQVMEVQRLLSGQQPGILKNCAYRYL